MKRQFLLLFILLISMPLVLSSSDDKILVYIQPESVDNNLFSISRNAVSTFDIDVREEDHIYESTGGIRRYVTFEELLALQDNPFVSVSTYLDIPFVRYMNEANLVTGASSVWSLEHNGVPITGSGQTVCVIDDGVDITHPDISDKILFTYDFVENTEVITHPLRHGTHVAGSVAGNGAINGSAPGANLIVLDVFSGGPFTTQAIYNEAIDWCINNRETYNISVISMSLGGGQYPICDSFEGAGSTRDLIDTATDLGMSVVIATGNTDPDDYPDPLVGVGFPACLSNAIRVGATTKTDEITFYSFRNSTITDIIHAPGGVAAGACTPLGSTAGICSLDVGGGYFAISGTSMAAPQVSGMIALIQQYRLLSGQSLMSRDEIVDLFFDTGVALDDSNGTGNTYVRADISAVFDVLLEENSLSSDLFLNVSELFFNESVLIEWSGEGFVDDVLIEVRDRIGDLVYSNTSLSGSVVLGLDNFSLSGLYNVSLNVSNEFSFDFVVGSFNVLKVDPVVNLSLNGSQDNLSGFGETVVVISSAESSGGPYDLLINGELNETGIQINTEITFNELGTYNITIRHEETEFYNQKQETLFVEVGYFDPSGSIDIDYFLIPNTGENRNIVWNTTSDVVFSNFSIFDPNDELFFTSLDSSGETGTLGHSNLSVEGTYTIFLYVENDFLNNTLTSNFTYTKLVGGFIFNINSDNETVFVAEQEEFVVSVQLFGNANASLFIDSVLNATFNDSSQTHFLNFSFDVLGVYNFTVVSENTSIFNPRNDTILVDVVALPPQISPFPNVSLVSLYENESLMFVGNASDRLNRTLEERWFLDSVEVSSNSTYLFNESVGNYNLTYVAFIDETRVSNFSWNVSVNFIPPTILSFSPDNEGVVELKQNRTLSFSHESVNYVEVDLNYSWFVNEVLEGEDVSFVFDGNRSIGFYNVTLVVDNGNASSGVTWNVSVTPNRAPIYVGDDLDDVVLRINEDLTLINDLNLLFDDPDGDSLTFNLVRESGSAVVDFDINENTGRIIVIGTNVGERSHRIVATDEDGLSTFSPWFSIDVRPALVTPASDSTPGGAAGGGAGGPLSDSNTNTNTNNVSGVSETSSGGLDSSGTTIAAGSSGDVFGSSEVRTRTRGLTLSQAVISFVDFDIPIKHYKILNINSGENREAVLEFEVNKSWILDNNLSINQVALFRFVDGELVELPTSVLREFDNYVVYEATTPGFSIFVIGESLSFREENPENINSSDGFGQILFYIFSAVISIGAILGVIVLVEKKAKVFAEKKVDEFNKEVSSLDEQIDIHKKNILKFVEADDISSAKREYQVLKEIYDHNLMVSDDKRKELKPVLLELYNKIINKK